MKTRPAVLSQSNSVVASGTEKFEIVPRALGPELAPRISNFLIARKTVDFDVSGAQKSLAHENSILLVDDKPENLLTLQLALDGLHANLITAQSGEDALRSVLQHDFAVILLDIRMPGMDGFETAKLIRDREQNKRTPIIFLTAYGDGEARIAQGYSLGAVDYIQKPFNPKILQSKVKVFLDLHNRTRQISSDDSTSWARECAKLEMLSSQRNTDITAGTFGYRPLREAVPQEFEQLASTYSDLLNRALERRIYKEKQEHAEDADNRLRIMAQDLGFLNAGPRDVIDVHIAGLKNASNSTTTQKSNALAEEGRLLMLELMGHLVSYYRNHAPMLRRSAP